MKLCRTISLLLAVCGISVFLFSIASCQFQTTKAFDEFDLSYSQNLDGTYAVRSLNIRPDASRYTIHIPAEYKGQPVTVIENYAFAGLDGLSTVIISDNIRRINAGAFMGCKQLESIQLPNTLELIDCDAFTNCSNLKSVNIPASLCKIKENAFSGCVQLTDVIIDPNNKKYSWCRNCLIDHDTNTLLVAGMNAEMPDDGSIVRIGEGAFINHDELSKIVIPEHVKEIGIRAFAGCANATEVVFSTQLERIEASAFLECELLNNVRIPDNVLYIGNGAFDNTAFLDDAMARGDDCVYSGRSLIYVCREATNIQIKEDTLLIAANAFRGCDSLSAITIPDGVRYVNAAFCDCNTLVELTLPASIQLLPYHMVDRCPNLKTVKYTGTSEQWEELKKEEEWIYSNITVDILIAKE